MSIQNQTSYKLPRQNLQRRQLLGGSIKNCRIGVGMSLTETVIGGGFSNGGIHNDKEHGAA